jgi:hypothetical protein
VSSEAEQQAWVKGWARRIEALNLSPVMLSLLEIARPFGLLGGQALLLAQPLLNGIVSETTVERIAILLNDPDLLEQLKMRLEGEEE